MLNVGKMIQKVIFLIDSEYFDKNLLGLTLEKYTKCKVFNFFSFEETLLYKSLKPSLILHDNNRIDSSFYDEAVNFYDLSNDRKVVKEKRASEAMLDVASHVKDFITSR